jgi:precorrin-6Y C5,15-methyltransferase (decarboxylating)
MKSQQIILAGIGMGSGDVITEEVRQLIEEADCRSRTNDYECTADS